MQGVRTLPAIRRYAPLWPFALGLALAIPALAMAAQVLTLDGPLAHAQDWEVFGRAAGAILSGRNPYADELFRWNPLTAYLFAVLTVMPYWLWALLHVAAALALPSPARWVALVSWPLWFDVLVGNVMAFVLVLAWFALEGRRWAVWGFLAVALLVPRPLMLPVLAWLLWKRPESRLPFAVLAVGIGVGTLLTGWTGEYVARLAEVDYRSIIAWGPLYPLTLALGAWLTWKGRLGFAALLVSPYLIVNYLLVLVLELRPHEPAEAGRPTKSSPRQSVRAATHERRRNRSSSLTRCWACRPRCSSPGTSSTAS